MPVEQRVPDSWEERRFLHLVEAVRERLLRERPQLLREPPGPELRQRLEAFVTQVLVRPGALAGTRVAPGLVRAICAEMVGLGPIDGLLDDDAVTEIMVNGPHRIFVERNGRIEPFAGRFRDAEHLVETINRIVAPLGRRVDPAHPFVDARLPNGDRIHAVVPPLAVDGPVLTIRRFRRQRPGLDDLVRQGTLTPAAARYLAEAVRSRRNVLISGATSSGKTTTLIALLRAATHPLERIITLEEAAEIDLGPDRHVVRLEARPPGLDGQGAVPLRTLLRNALRMRPDRLVVGEVRGEEAADLMQALNTGHLGSVSTIHANGSLDALRRLEQLVLMAGENWPPALVREQVSRAIHVVVHQQRLPGGRRVVAEICEVRPDGRLEPVSLASYPGAIRPACNGTVSWVPAAVGTEGGTPTT
ncbi:type II secretion system protein E [Thermaerobacter marianensis DSM 12885]|uniref:Type II secretion system protein E n=1 Tax=Thermaerobacter marianensis (strain ATCC 700841 / DSM 12885 / JCM 10246 / 7p75a) TaxID=644966 RepID=E6SL84_THEM7|nr:CpaF family protein [Thermaerobacter marianensis]ADU51315.1 type II secretion system protein E [Thermaerobacter marianensis DSM 12885]